MNFKMFLILYKFLKDWLRTPSPEAWDNLENELAENSAGFKAYLAGED